MSTQSFALIPFPAASIPVITLTGEISLQEYELRLDYVLAGNVNDIYFPPITVNPGRKDELWKTTCFEFFLALKDQARYWEFNLSPSGDWNVYAMDAYRRSGFRQDQSISRLPFDVRFDDRHYFLSVCINLLPIIPSAEPLQAGITAIIQTKDGRETYWSLHHPAAQADFHLRDGFVCSL
jgi:hypothetical protein